MLPFGILQRSWHDEDQVLSRHTAVIGKQVEDEWILMQLDTGQFFTLDEDDALHEVWALLEAPTKLKDIITHLTDTFDIDGQTCRDEVRALLDDLIRHKLVMLASPSREAPD